MGSTGLLKENINPFRVPSDKEPRMAMQKIQPETEWLLRTGNRMVVAELYHLSYNEMEFGTKDEG